MQSLQAPYINIPKERLLETVLNTGTDDFETWPGESQEIALRLASEFFLVLSNPFVPPERVKENIFIQLEQKAQSIPANLREYLKEKFDLFWHDFQKQQIFKNKVKSHLASAINKENIEDSPHSLTQFATDATGLILELPMLVIYPESTKEIQSVVQLANELGFSIVPRGGGTGLTGGAVPGLRYCVIMSLSRMKTIFEVDPIARTLHAQSGVITIDAIRAAKERDLLLTVDPASKNACSLGGNIAENAGGPFAFEFGTTLDNILSYRMVSAQGEILEIRRKNHPRHKIYPEETVSFEILDEHGSFQGDIVLKGSEIRSPGLGKDVTNKFLGGLPGVQKEGVDGIITEVRFILHPRLKYSKTLCLEFYGPSMHNAALVIQDLVQLRDKIREKSNLVTMSALEEFGSKYVQAINYIKKSDQFEGEPISVLLVELDANNSRVLEEVVWTIVDIAENHDNVEVFVARDHSEAEIFWEDRHKLSAISSRTSGFKINEDVVIPLDKIPEFSDYIEECNIYYLAYAYQEALQRVLELEGIDEKDEFIEMELDVCAKIKQGAINTNKLSEQEFALQIHFFFQDLFSRYAGFKKQLTDIKEDLFNFKIEIANHMHAGDGNCHLNLPVHATNQKMVSLAEEAVSKIFAKVLELGGEVSGEHGIGITKIGYLPDEKIEALKQYKAAADPGQVFNPGKLTQRKMPVLPYTLSWERLIQDIPTTNLPYKEKVAEMLNHIQICTRCGKCKQVCPMYYPEKGYLHHPRNKNLSLKALLEAWCYLEHVDGKYDQGLSQQLKDLVGYCTTCGKCMSICPVKINSAKSTLTIRSFLEDEISDTQSLKSKMLNFFSDPERIQFAAKAAAVGVPIQHTAIRFIPPFWRRRLHNPIFKEPIPRIEKRHLYDVLDLKKGNIFIPEAQRSQAIIPGVLYFPGCGCGLFFSEIALAGIYLLLKAGVAVIVPEEHKCCGYPLLFGGSMQAFEKNKSKNLKYFKGLFKHASKQGIVINYLLTSCGTCRAAFERHSFQKSLPGIVQLMDVLQFVLPYLDSKNFKLSPQNKILYHASCHNAWSNVSPDNAGRIYSKNLQEFLGTTVDVSSYCCAESGLGAITAPKVYNKLRNRKTRILTQELDNYPEDNPVLVSCPSCKIGITRILNNIKEGNNVLHSLEYIAAQVGGSSWKSELLSSIEESKEYQKNVVHLELEQC